ncbi:MAG: UDP-N-acetylmuramate dehydrogenase [Lachnospiraceae bacterium]|nr:UDP-N-acetylmuramate dehydrogenase [Lachnospiraceae bacterium]
MDIAVFRDEPMSEHTTFKCGGNAALFMQPHTEEELVVISDVLERYDVPWYVTGNGSNLLVSDSGYDGVIINTLGLRSTGDEISFFSENPIEGDECTGIRVRAGVLLSRVANAAMERGLTGLEFASGIPGSVGGAVVMNAGAYGGEISQVIGNTTVISSGGKSEILTKEELKLGYRDSIFKHERHICYEVDFHLKKGDRNQIKATMQDMNEKRRAKQPLEYPSAGSTFKRPEGHFAGKLIMEAGLAGYSIGGARVSEKHCGFIINAGGATATDIKNLMDHVAKKVFENSGIMLEREVCLLGDFG